jgi:hypothetical protein
MIDNATDLVMSVHSIHSTVLGGTHQEGDFDRSPRDEDSARIYDGCCRLMPSLQVPYDTIHRALLIKSEYHS